MNRPTASISALAKGFRMLQHRCGLGIEAPIVGDVSSTSIRCIDAFNYAEERRGRPPNAAASDLQPDASRRRVTPRRVPASTCKNERLERQRTAETAWRLSVSSEREPETSGQSGRKMTPGKREDAAKGKEASTSNTDVAHGPEVGRKGRDATSFFSQTYFRRCKDSMEMVGRSAGEKRNPSLSNAGKSRPSAWKRWKLERGSGKLTRKDRQHRTHSTLV